MKRSVLSFLCLCLAAALLLGAAPTAKADGEGLINLLVEMNARTPPYTLDGGALRISKFEKSGTTMFSYGDMEWSSPWRNSQAVKSVTIEYGLPNIGSETFFGCSNLTTVTIPASVTSIGDGAFAESGVTDIYYGGSQAKWSMIDISKTGLSDAVTVHYRVGDFGGHSYCVFDLHSTWDEAKAYCEILGGHLATITSPEEDRYLYQFMLDSGCDNAFFGFTDEAVEGVWQWITGEAVSYTNWEAKEPNSDKSGEDYGSYIRVYNGQWNDMDFGDVGITAFLCEWDYPYSGDVPVEAAGGLAYPSTQVIQVDGKPVSFQMYALKDASGNPTNYIKVRDLAYKLDGTAAQFEVGWSWGSVSLESGKSYTANGSEMSTPFSGNRLYSIPSGKTVVNGDETELQAIYLTDDSGGGYTYYKLRDLGQALGFAVDWSADIGISIRTEP